MDFSYSTTFHLAFVRCLSTRWQGQSTAVSSDIMIWASYNLHVTVERCKWEPLLVGSFVFVSKKDVLKLYFLRIYVIQIPFKSLRRLVETVSNKKPISWRIRRFARREPCLGLTCWHQKVWCPTYLEKLQGNYSTHTLEHEPCKSGQKFIITILKRGLVGRPFFKFQYLLVNHHGFLTGTSFFGPHDLRGTSLQERGWSFEWSTSTRSLHLRDWTRDCASWSPIFWSTPPGRTWKVSSGFNCWGRTMGPDGRCWA